MIQLILFSKDNAVQLRNLIISINRYCSDKFNINIIYTFSTPEYQFGYEKLKNEELLPNINWIVQDDCKQQVMNLIKPDYEYVCFGLDTDAFYATFDEMQIVHALSEDKSVFCFALNLGKNITRNLENKSQEILITLEEVNDIIKWNWTKHYLSFSNPLSLNFHVFRSKEISKLIKQLRFKNDIELEESMQIFEALPWNLMASFKKSVTVNMILKNVLSSKELNVKYINGDTLDYNDFDFINICGTQQEFNI